MKSMTGYGTAIGPLGDGEVVVEIRALNHRYLDIRTVASADLGPYAHEAEQTLRRAVVRGRYELRLRTSGATPAAMSLDLEAARHVYQALATLKREIGDETPLSLEGALGVLPEPLIAPRATPDVAEGVRAAVQSAVKDLNSMRDAEGATLRAELLASLAAVRAHRAQAGEQSTKTVAAHHERLRERVAKLLADSETVARERIEVEIAMLADRTDVTEELVRLDSHAAQIETLLNSAEASVGRKLDFLLQELNREANTLAAKCQDASVTHIAVAIKAEVERMRQQAANVL